MHVSAEKLPAFARTFLRFTLRFILEKDSSVRLQRVGEVKREALCGRSPLSLLHGTNAQVSGIPPSAPSLLGDYTLYAHACLYATMLRGDCEIYLH